MTALRTQIAAARALVDDWKIDSGDIRNELEAMCDRLDRACELLRELDEDLGPDSLAVRIRAFLAGEVK